jgi:hypothetical protein
LRARMRKLDIQKPCYHLVSPPAPQPHKR